MVISVKPWGPVWKVDTPSGVYALKRTRKQPAQILQLVRTMECLRDSGFPNMVSFRADQSGRPFTCIHNNNYLLSPWLEGEHPDFTNQRHLQLAAGLYGRFHQVSQTIAFPDEVADGPPEPARTIGDEFLEKRAFLIQMAGSLSGREKNNRIDRQLLKWSGHFIRQADFCIEQLSKLRLDEWYRQKTGQGFCHNDPAPGNIIIRNRELFLIDFELAAPGPFIKEAAKLLVRALQANRWPDKMIPLVMKAYTAERDFTAAEIQILPYLCSFPQSFWRLCSQRFQEQLPWTETHFQRKLWEITSSESLRLNCLRNMAPELPEMALSIP